MSTSSDRRNALRHLACGLAFIDREEGTPRRALIADISTTGALLLTRADLAAGAQVALTLHILPGQPPVETLATVVRVGERPLALADVWRFDAAVHFETALTVDEALTWIHESASRWSKEAGGNWALMDADDHPLGSELGRELDTLCGLLIGRIGATDEQATSPLAEDNDLVLRCEFAVDDIAGQSLRIDRSKVQQGQGQRTRERMGEIRRRDSAR